MFLLFDVFVFPLGLPYDRLPPPWGYPTPWGSLEHQAWPGQSRLVAPHSLRDDGSSGQAPHLWAGVLLVGPRAPLAVK